MGFHKNLRGADLHAPSNELIENGGVSTLTKMKVVTLDGMGTNYPKVKVNDASVDSAFGIVQGDILAGGAGYVTCLGFMFDVDTSAWSPGTVLYSDSSGDLSTSAEGGEIAEVIKQDVNFGIIYVLALGSFISAPVGNIFWGTSGNLGLNSTKFIGTTDSVALNFKTNNNQVGQFDVNGRFAIGSHSPASPLHIKSYPGYSDSGFRLDTLSLTSATSVAIPAYTIPMVDGQIVSVTWKVAGRQSDGTARCAFTRSALFYKQGGNVQIQGQDWTSDVTIKSDNAFDVDYTLGVSSVTFKVKNAVDLIDTYWSGHVEMEFLSGAT